MKLVKGYRRGQGFIFREDDPRFQGFQESFQERFEEMLSDPELRMINRNRGSGTRVLIDGLLGKHQPQGFLYEAKSHQAVAAAVAQSRADWGVAIRSVAEDQGLGFIPLQDEEYDFIIPESRLQKPAVQALIGLLDEKPIIERLEQMGLIRNQEKIDDESIHSRKWIPVKKSEKLFIKLFVMLLRSIAWTSRTELENEGIIDEARRLHGGFILSTWHRDIFFSIWMFRELNLTAMISASRDGEGIFQVMRHFNFQGIRGSSNRGGTEALLETTKFLKQGGGLAIAPDGPTGPSLKSKPGIILLARDSGMPIIPWSYASKTSGC